MAKLTILRGLPGSGKTLYAKKNYDCLILENDMFLIHGGKYDWSPARVKTAIRMCIDFASKALAAGADVVIANTFTKRKFVAAYEKLAKAYGADFEVIRMEHDYGNVHSVPAGVLKSMHEGFEDWPGEIIK